MRRWSSRRSWCRRRGGAVPRRRPLLRTGRIVPFLPMMQWSVRSSRTRRRGMGPQGAPPGAPPGPRRRGGRRPPCPSWRMTRRTVQWNGSVPTLCCTTGSIHASRRCSTGRGCGRMRPPALASVPSSLSSGGTAYGIRIAVPPGLLSLGPELSGSPREQPGSCKNWHFYSLTLHGSMVYLRLTWKPWLQAEECPELELSTLMSKTVDLIQTTTSGRIPKLALPTAKAVSPGRGSPRRNEMSCSGGVTSRRSCRPPSRNS